MSFTAITTMRIIRMTMPAKWTYPSISGRTGFLRRSSMIWKRRRPPSSAGSGSRLNTLITALAVCSNDYRAAVRSEITEKGAKDSAQMLEIIAEGAKLDLGILFGWGDIRDHIANGFNKSTSAADLLADRMTEMRNKAAETAASILAGKLGIE